MKATIVYKETLKKGSKTDIASINKLLSVDPEHTSIEVKERGKMSDGSEFITIKITVA
jgi:hypothetical protein